MCTAISFSGKEHYFGRNLDLEYSYSEQITVIPRRFPVPFRKWNELQEHYAIIGMAYTVNGFPLFYDATNEYGLSVAGLHFPGNAFYFPENPPKINITPFELIPFLLCQCKNVRHAVHLLRSLHPVNLPFSEELPLSPLHWMVSDRTETVTVEPRRDGLHILNNPVGVLTNNPPFETQLLSLQKYKHLSPEETSENPSIRGLSSLGLPGDWSSPSRFAKAAFVRQYSRCGTSEAEEVSQFFHILKSVEQPLGCVRLKNGMQEKTVYSSCCNTKSGIYYYTTYENSQISAVNLRKINLESRIPVHFPLIRKQQFYEQN